MGLIRKVQRALMISLICVEVLIIVLFRWMYSTGCSFQSHCYSSNTIDSAATKAPVPCNVNIFLESFNQIDNIKELQHNFSNFEESIPRTCPLPNGGKCTVQHSNYLKADVVFRVVRAVSTSNPVRYYQGQIVAVLNMEADRSAYGIYTYGVQQLKQADIRIDHHPSSDAVYTEPCYFLPIKEWQRGELQPSDPTERKGIALFSSDCRTQWEGFQNRTRYYEQLINLVHIDSYGKCWHNMPEVPAMKGDDWREVFVNISKKYRMVIAFENIIEPDYISGKIAFIYRAGAIPVYRGPPEVYLWVPGNHTFIDANKFTPEELAKYIKRVDEDDDLFRYHTSNFDVERSRKRVEAVCPKANFMCRVCQLAHDIKVNRRTGQPK